ncbi:putative histone deacetylase SIR2 [Pyronema omphalodes]|nr:putative histone deacetylase SIR2 [Pyronema omphalodes]
MSAPQPPPTTNIVEDSESELSELSGYDTVPEVDSDEENEAWDSESLLGDALEEMRTEVFDEEDDAVTPEERKQFKALLKSMGEDDFIHTVVQKGGMSIRKLLTVFNIRAPSFMSDHTLISLLQIVVGRAMVQRTRIPHVNSVEHVVDLLRKSKNIIVLTGAGISTSLGIPDFRSKGSGLYSRLESLGLHDPQEVFDINIFNEDPTIFYSVAKDILPETKQFSPTHAFIALLQSKNKLLTQYTQNIDNLEHLAGILPEKLIQCHGSFATASCTKCGHKVPGETIFPEIKRCQIAKCDNCLRLLAESSAAGKKRKRSKKPTNSSSKSSSNPSTTGTPNPSTKPPVKSKPKPSKSADMAWPKKKRFSEDSSADEEESNFREAGVMKPDITFFGEQLPDTFHNRLVTQDRLKADLLVCIGTSLKVAPVSEIIGFLPENVPQIYISKTPVNHIEFDVELLGPCDEVVAELCRLAGWTLTHEMLPPSRPKVFWSRIEGPGNRYEYVDQDISAT